jgi:hypothetical protein
VSRRERASRRQAFRREEAALLRILNDWDPIRVGPPPDEYDCLAHHVLGLLHRGAAQDDVRDLLEREVADHFGIRDIPPAEFDGVATRILRWWGARTM